MREAYEKTRSLHPEYGAPRFPTFPTLAETHELLEKAGFYKAGVFAIHQIDFVDPSVFLPARDATTSWWQIGLPSEALEHLKKEFTEEMRKRKMGRGSKITSYIIAHAQKTWRNSAHFPGSSSVGRTRRYTQKPLATTVRIIAATPYGTHIEAAQRRASSALRLSGFFL